ncbi:hypothetical protein [Pantoea ananatis]|uniref:hypothetical protein n=1 Tax=Pantoea ananas TaxID=553 RepID=UPI00128E980D|nr:hypothetical protein [Pantoea ananatis]UYL01070.1 hypothetical protein NG830_17940 [Pantoea ananatis]
MKLALLASIVNLSEFLISVVNTANKRRAKTCSYSHKLTHRGHCKTFFHITHRLLFPMQGGERAVFQEKWSQNFHVSSHDDALQCEKMIKRGGYDSG